MKHTMQCWMMRVGALALAVTGAAMTTGAPTPPIVAAAQIGDLERVAAILATEPAAACAVDSRGFTALHWAAIRAHDEVARALLAAGAPADVAGGDGGTPLHWASHHDAPGLVAALLERGARVNAANRWGRAALHVAARRGCRRVAGQLVAAGADLTATTQEGWTPLHVAERAGHSGVAAILLRAGADPAARDGAGRIPADMRWRRPPVRAFDWVRDADVVGEYDLAGERLVVWREAGRLRLSEFAPDDLLPVGPDRFVCRREPWVLEFGRDDADRVQRVTVRYLRRTVAGERLAFEAGPIGSAACGRCHPDEYAAWVSSRHNLAYWRLATDWARHLARQRPEYRNVSDPQDDARCLGCHTTAAVVGVGPLVAVPLATEGVGCEACHGPGGAWSTTELMSDRPRRLARGAVEAGADACRCCHRDEHFDYRVFRARLAHPGPVGDQP